MRTTDRPTNAWSPPQGRSDGKNTQDRKDGQDAAGTGNGNGHPQGNGASSSSSSSSRQALSIAAEGVTIVPPSLRRSTRTASARARAQLQVQMADEAAPPASLRGRRVVEKRKAEPPPSQSASGSSGTEGSDDESAGSQAEAAERKSAKKPKAVRPSATGRAGASGKTRGPDIDLATPLDELLQACLPPASRGRSARAQPDIGPMRQAMHAFFCGTGKGLRASRVGRGLRQLMPWIAGLSAAQRDLVIEAFADTVTARGALRRLLPTIHGVLLAHSDRLGDACAPAVRALARALGPQFLTETPDDAGERRRGRPASLVSSLLTSSGSAPLWTGVLQALQDAQAPQEFEAWLDRALSAPTLQYRPTFFQGLVAVLGGPAMPVEQVLRITRLTLGEPADPARPGTVQEYTPSDAWCQALAGDGLAPAHAQALRAFWLEATTPGELARRGNAIACALLGRQPTPAAFATFVEQVQQDLPGADAARRAAALTSTARSVMEHNPPPVDSDPPDTRALLVPQALRLASALLARDGMDQAETVLGALRDCAKRVLWQEGAFTAFYDALLDRMIERGWFADRALAARLLAAVAPSTQSHSRSVPRGHITVRFPELETYFAFVIGRAASLQADDVQVLAQAGARAMGGIGLRPPAADAPPEIHPLAQAIQDAPTQAPATLETLVRGLAQGTTDGPGLPGQLRWAVGGLNQTLRASDAEARRAMGRGLAQGLLARPSVQADVETVARSLMRENQDTSPPRPPLCEGFIQGLGGAAMDRRLAWRLVQTLAVQEAAPQPPGGVARFAGTLAHALGAAAMARVRADAAARWDLPAPPRPRREGKGDVPDGPSDSAMDQGATTVPAEQAAAPDPLASLNALLAQARTLPALPGTLPPLPEILPAQREAARMVWRVGEEAYRLPPLPTGAPPTEARQRLAEIRAVLEPYMRSDAPAPSADSLRDTLRAFESRYAPDLDADDWMHDATALGWRLGVAAMAPALRNQLILLRIERLRTLAAAPGARDCPDPLLAGFLGAVMTRQMADAEVSAFVLRLRQDTLGAVFSGIVAPADPGARPALVDTAAQVLRWTSATLAQATRTSDWVFQSVLVAISTAPTAPQHADMRRWLSREEAGRLLLSAAEALQLARDDQAFGALLDALMARSPLPVSLLFTYARAVRPLLSAGPRPHADQLAWSLARIAQQSTASPQKATAVALGLCPSHATAQALLKSIRGLPLAQQANLVRIARDASTPQDMAALASEIPRELATVPDAAPSFPGVALTDAQAVSLAVAFAVASFHEGVSDWRHHMRPFTARTVPADAPPPSTHRQTLCRHAATLVAGPWRALTDPVLADHGQGQLLDRLLSLPQMQAGPYQRQAWGALMSAPLAPADKLAAASRMVRHASRYLAPTAFRFARLSLSEEFMSIVYTAAPTAPANEQAQADYTVRLVEAASHIAAVYHRLRDDPHVAFVWQPVADAARRVEQVRQQHHALSVMRSLLDEEIVAVSRPHVHERLRASLLPVLEGLHGPVVAALALLQPTAAAGDPLLPEAAMEVDIQPLD